MIFGQFVDDEERLGKIEDVREDVFGRRNCDLAGVTEAKSLLFLEDGAPVGEAVCGMKDFRFTVIEIGVKEERRFEHYGDFMIRMIADLTISLGKRYAYACVPKEAEDFFISEHFELVEGDLYCLDPERLRCGCSKQKFNPYDRTPCAGLKLRR